MTSPLNVKRNPYINNPKRQDIETPEIVANFIASLFPSVKSVFDPCVGGGNLLKPFKDRAKIRGIDIKQGTDFLKTIEPIREELTLCNPPFNLGVGRKLGSEIFLEHIVKLGGKKIVLFVPMGFRLNQRIKSRRWKWLRDKMPQITSIISLPLDIFKGVQFHSEVLIFNAPELKPHYFLNTPNPNFGEE